jgi:hypothetical protein
MSNQEKAKFLRNAITSQFFSKSVNLDTRLSNDCLWLTFSSKKERQVVSIPLPRKENGLTLISNNGVDRALTESYSETEGRVISYEEAVRRTVCGDPSGLLPKFMIKKKPFIRQIASSFESGSASLTAHNLQRAINELVNGMPLHKHDMNSWSTNRRLTIVDPEFNAIADPKRKLEYQVRKNEKHFDKGWTSIGLSDGTLADKNYVLTVNLRKFSPFGLRHDNPGRNLYSTQEAKGDEKPRVRSESAQKLIEKGVTRKGWNLRTLFVEVPDVFEDQILVDESHASKFVSHLRKHVCFGVPTVKEGQKIKFKQTLSVTKDGERTLCRVRADESTVKKVEKIEVNANGEKMEAHSVIVEYKRNLKDGTKITNLHGNKGVIRLKRLGHSVDPRTGEKKRIDVIVSAKSVKKRKNFGQILEALLNETNGDGKVRVVRDDAETSLESVERALERVGLPKDGTAECETPFGNLRGIVGDVFWGVTKEAEDQLWGRGDVVRENGRGLRTSGLKFSSVEFRALATRFGKDNPVLDEIMSYSQGAEDLNEQLNVLRSKKGEAPGFKPVVSCQEVKPVLQTEGRLLSERETRGTVLDESFFPEGFILKTPLEYQVQLDENDRVEYEGYPQTKLIGEAVRAVNVNEVYVPSSNLRRCWRHDSGKLGLSEIGARVNGAVKACVQHLSNPNDEAHIRAFYVCLRSYFHGVAMRMGSKKGELSSYGMSVRYPFSAKAVATLSNSLPRNVVEIHSSVARNLGVSTGDVILVERFPCLGFMSIRPQKVKVTSDPKCRHAIRVSGNSLGSTSLDFDGDVLFLASFHSKEAKEALRKEWANPNKSCYDVIKKLNKKAGVPHVKSLSLRDYGLQTFPDLTNAEHAELVRRATGVKSHTGPVIALAYNLMRILENSPTKDNQKTNVAIEVFLDKVGNSVFKQKHGIKSLHDLVTDAICVADANSLVENGFERGTSRTICDAVKRKAGEIGVFDLKSYHEKATANGWSKIINLIVRRQNKTWFASRSQLEGCELLKHLEAPAVDLPSRTVKWTMAGKNKSRKTEMERKIDEATGIGSLKNQNVREACASLCEWVETTLSKGLFRERTEKLKARFA